VRSYRSVCTERASCCGAFRSWTFPSLLTHCQPPCSSIVFAVAAGGCVLILSVFGRGLLVGFRRFRRRCQGGGSIGQSPNSRPRLAVRDAKSKQVQRRTDARNSSRDKLTSTSGCSRTEHQVRLWGGLLYFCRYRNAMSIRMWMRCKQETASDAHASSLWFIMTKMSAVGYVSVLVFYIKKGRQLRQ
jgi:hypothetical protein